VNTGHTLTFLVSRVSFLSIHVDNVKDKVSEFLKLLFCFKVDPSHRHTVNISGGSLSYNYQVDQNTIHVSCTVQCSKIVHFCRDVSFSLVGKQICLCHTAGKFELQSRK
jgi:hypothetical protein